MSERKRCQTITYIGQVDIKNGQLPKAMRAICDRPIGHPPTVHKGRLTVGQDVYGIVEWSIDR